MFICLCYFFSVFVCLFVCLFVFFFCFVLFCFVFVSVFVSVWFLFCFVLFCFYTGSYSEGNWKYPSVHWYGPVKKLQNQNALRITLYCNKYTDTLQSNGWTQFCTIVNKIPLKGMRLVQRDSQIPVGWIENCALFS